MFTVVPYIERETIQVFLEKIIAEYHDIEFECIFECFFKNGYMREEYQTGIVTSDLEKHNAAIDTRMEANSIHLSDVNSVLNDSFPPELLSQEVSIQVSLHVPVSQIIPLLENRQYDFEKIEITLPEETKYCKLSLDKWYCSFNSLSDAIRMKSTLQSLCPEMPFSINEQLIN